MINEYRTFYLDNPTNEKLESVKAATDVLRVQGKDKGALPPGTVGRVTVSVHYQIGSGETDFQRLVSAVENSPERVAEVLYDEGYRAEEVS